MAYEAWLRGLRSRPMSWKDWVRGVEIEPSLYAADFSRLGEQIETVMDAGARIFQFDVGDGHFVEPITIGPIVLKSISPLVHELGGVLDCHLMIVSPEKHFRAIAEAGGDSVTVHYEAVRRPARRDRAGAGARAWRRRRVQPGDRAGAPWPKPPAGSSTSSSA